MVPTLNKQGPSQGQTTKKTVQGLRFPLMKDELSNDGLAMLNDDPLPFNTYTQQIYTFQACS